MECQVPLHSEQNLHSLYQKEMAFPFSVFNDLDYLGDGIELGVSIVHFHHKNLEIRFQMCSTEGIHFWSLSPHSPGQPSDGVFFQERIRNWGSLLAAELCKLLHCLHSGSLPKVCLPLDFMILPLQEVILTVIYKTCV